MIINTIYWLFKGIECAKLLDGDFLVSTGHKMSLLIKIKRSQTFSFKRVWRPHCHVEASVGSKPSSVCVCPSGVDVQTRRHEGDAESVPVDTTVWLLIPGGPHKHQCKNNYQTIKRFNDQLALKSRQKLTSQTWIQGWETENIVNRSWFVIVSGLK